MKKTEIFLTETVSYTLIESEIKHPKVWFAMDEDERAAQRSAFFTSAFDETSEEFKPSFYNYAAGES